MGLLLFKIEVEKVKRTEDLQNVEIALHQAGFQVSQRCISRASCFDFATRRDGSLIFIKVFLNINDISKTSAQGIRTVSRCFSAASLFISKMKGEEMLRDDTVYSRYGVNVVTPKTFEDTCQRNIHPLVKAAPGGYFVKMDGRKIRERRHELRLSIGKLAAMTDISRRTLYGYEKGMTCAAVQVAYKLEKVLGVPLVKTVDLFEASRKVPAFISTDLDNCDNVRSGIVMSALKNLSQLNLRVSFIPKAPFRFCC